MFRPRLFQYTDIIFILLVCGIVAAIFYFIFNDQGQKQQQKLYEYNVHNSFIASLAQAKSNAILLYQLQYDNQIVNSLLDQANSTLPDSEELESIQSDLYEHLQREFQASRELFSHQQLYLRNGQPFLHLDEGEHSSITEAKINPGLKRVLSSHEASFGLSLRNGQYQYRYLFPIFNQQNHFAGVVEMALPLSTMQRALKHAINVKSQFLFVKRRLVHLQHKGQLYDNSHFEDMFYIPNQVVNDIDKTNMLEQNDLQQVQLSLSGEEHTKLLQLKRLSFATSIDGQDGIAVFIPIYNVQGEDVGGIVTFSASVPLSLSKTDISALQILVLVLLVLIVLYIIKKSLLQYMVQCMYQRFLDAMPFPVFIKYDGSEYLRANKAFYQFFNIHKKKLLDKKQGFDSEPEMLRVSLAEINEMGGCVEQEYEDYKDGQPFIYKLLFFSTKPSKHTSQAIIGYVQDITEKKQLNASLQASIFDHKQFMDLLPLGVRVFNIEGLVTYINKTFEKLSGYNEEDFLEQACSGLFSCLQCDLSNCPLKRIEEFEKPLRIETIKYNKRHEAGTYEVRYQPYYSLDKRLQGVLEITRDITEDKFLLDKNHELMLSDELTGLYNSRGLFRAGENYFRLAARANKPFFILYIDVYGMRKINAEHGEAAGDSLLKAFADILRETFRETDIIARTGGDEFVVLMNDSDYRLEDNTCFSRLERNVNKYNETQSSSFSLVIDTGIVEYHNQRHESLQALLNEGEELVYEQKFNRTLN